jgi:hypothetical protein
VPPNSVPPNAGKSHRRDSDEGDQDGRGPHFKSGARSGRWEGLSPSPFPHPVRRGEGERRAGVAQFFSTGGFGQDILFWQRHCNNV